jgi:hypothetical protein
MTSWTGTLDPGSPDQVFNLTEGRLRLPNGTEAAFSCDNNLIHLGVYSQLAGLTPPAPAGAPRPVPPKSCRLDADAPDLARYLRGHWGIEAPHHIRDVAYAGDASRVRTGGAPRVTAPPATPPSACSSSPDGTTSLPPTGTWLATTPKHCGYFISPPENTSALLDTVRFAMDRLFAALGVALASAAGQRTRAAHGPGAEGASSPDARSRAPRFGRGAEGGRVGLSSGGRRPSASGRPSAGEAGSTRAENCGIATEPQAGGVSKGCAFGGPPRRGRPSPPAAGSAPLQG